MNLRLNEARRALQAPYAAADKEISVISTDTRKITKGSLFFAIKGERFDGHDFAARAVKAGAAAVVTEKKTRGIKPENEIRVKSTVDALLKLAGHYYGKFARIRTLAVTGSNGKTTTKELAAAMLAEKYVTLKSEKSFNNHIGLPLTLFRADARTQAAVLELGMSAKGEIARLCSAFTADAVIVTNIGRAHIGKMKTLANTASAKAEIFSCLKCGGIAVLNADDRFYGFLKRRLGAKKTVSFGFSGKAAVRIKGFIETAKGMTFFLIYKGKKIAVNSPLKGKHNALNIAAAAAAAMSLGVPAAGVRRAAAAFKMSGLMRFDERFDSKRKIRIIADCYNANPDSFLASIGSLKAGNYRSIVAVAGEMAELGPAAARLHREIGRALSGLEIKKLFITGPHAKDMKAGFGKANAEIINDRAALALAVKKELRPGDALFVKGSRVNKLEEVLKKI